MRDKPEVTFLLAIPESESKPQIQANVKRLLRSRSSSMFLYNTHAKKRPSLSALTEQHFLNGSMSTDKMAEGRRQSVADDVTPLHMSNHRVLDRRRVKMALRRTLSKRRLYRKFRTVARMTTFCIRQCNEHCLSNSDDDELSPFLKSLTFHDYSNLAGVDLLFDPSKFKANKQVRIQADIRRIFSKPPSERSDHDLYTAQIAMRNIKCFQEFPARMQRLLAEVGMYQSFDARRVLVRQGHPAASFYFILSGTVVVMVMDADRKYARPVAYLYRGHAFGELAIINRTTRQSTVIAKERTELLTISVDDYHRIFMAGGIKCITDPDHEHFIRNLRFLSEWPLHLLHEQPSKCLFLYFKRGDILTKDSNSSDWIIVVKSGSISVLKKLRKVSSFECRTEHGFVDIGEEEREKCEMARKCQEWRSSVLPELRISMRECVDDETDYNSDHIAGTFEELRVQDSSSSLSSGAWQFANIKARHFLPMINLPNDARPARYDLRHTGRGRQGQGRRRVSRRSRRMLTGTHRGLNHSSDGTSECTAGNDSSRWKCRRQSVIEREREMLGFTEHVRTIGEDLDGGLKQKSRKDVTPADMNPEFVQVQILTKGQVFGLVDLFLGRQTSFCVVSNGADCLLLNKQFYKDHVTEKLRMKLSRELWPYPTETTLQTSLQTSVDWCAYRETTLADTLKQVKQRKPTMSRV